MYVQLCTAGCVVFLLSTSPARSQSAMELVQDCAQFERGLHISGDNITYPGTFDSGMCWGFMGAFQQLAAMQDEDRATTLVRSCPPADSKRTQLIRVFMSYADKHPEKLNYAAARLAVEALSSAFPCPD